MMFRLAGLACFALCLAGCAEEEITDHPVMAEGSSSHDDHDHGDHDQPESVGDAFHHIEELHETISAAYGKNDKDAAHGPLHEIGEMLVALKDLTPKSKLDDKAKTAVLAQVEILMDSYGAVDKMQHGKDGSTYSEVSQKVDTAMKDLESALGELAEHDGHHDEDGHDEDGHDHDDKDHDHKDKDKDDDHDHDHKEGDHDDDHDHKEKK